MYEQMGLLRMISRRSLLFIKLLVNPFYQETHLQSVGERGYQGQKESFSHRYLCSYTDIFNQIDSLCRSDFVCPTKIDNEKGVGRISFQFLGNYIVTCSYRVSDNISLSNLYKLLKVIVISVRNKTDLTYELDVDECKGRTL